MQQHVVVHVAHTHSAVHRRVHAVWVINAHLCRRTIIKSAKRRRNARGVQRAMERRQNARSQSHVTTKQSATMAHNCVSRAIALDQYVCYGIWPSVSSHRSTHKILISEGYANWLARMATIRQHAVAPVNLVWMLVYQPKAFHCDRVRHVITSKVIVMFFYGVEMLMPRGHWCDWKICYSISIHWIRYSNGLPTFGTFAYCVPYCLSFSWAYLLSVVPCTRRAPIQRNHPHGDSAKHYVDQCTHCDAW